MLAAAAWAWTHLQWLPAAVVGSREVACGVARSDTIPTQTRGESRMSLVCVAGPVVDVT